MSASSKKALLLTAVLTEGLSHLIALALWL